MSGLYHPNFSPARAASPQVRTTPDVDSGYLSELLAEHEKLGAFLQVLPICGRLLNQGFDDIDWSWSRHRSLSPMAASKSNVCGSGLGGWNSLPQRPSGPPGMAASPTVKRILRLEIPVGTYPNFNFVGRLLGPRGNSLKRVEATTGCRFYIRGGSRHDLDLNEPLHILIQAVDIVETRLKQAQEIIEDLLKPVDESQDFVKRENQISERIVQYQAAVYLRLIQVELNVLKLIVGNRFYTMFYI